MSTARAFVARIYRGLRRRGLLPEVVQISARNIKELLQKRSRQPSSLFHLQVQIKDLWQLTDNLSSRLKELESHSAAHADKVKLVMTWNEAVERGRERSRSAR